MRPIRRKITPLPNDRSSVDWDALVSREGPAVWRAVRRLVGNDADAEDVFQEVFVAAVEVSRREVVRQWRALLLRMAHARAIDRLRAKYRRADWEDDESGEVADTNFESVASARPLPQEEAEAAELSARLREALAQLPAKQSEVFCLFCLEGWTYQEISERLEMSIDAVGVTIHRARAKLKLLLAGGRAQRVVEGDVA
jgi:RNA polymerase sigma-70 factor (ECF subfamily)